MGVLGRGFWLQSNGLYVDLYIDFDGWNYAQRTEAMFDILAQLGRWIQWINNHHNDLLMTYKMAPYRDMWE